MSLINKFIVGHGDEAHLDKKAYNEFAKAFAAKRKSADAKVSLDNVNKLIASGSAGVAQLNSIEGDYMDLNIHRDSPALDFAEIRPLPLGTIPLYRTRTVNPVGVQVGSVNGMGSTVYYATKDAGVQVFPQTFTSEKVMVPNLNNIYDMVKLEQRKAANERLDEYVQMALTNICLNTVFNPATTGSVVTDDPAASIQSYFSGGGSFAGKSVYVLDPGVIAAGVPSINVYNLATENGLTKKVFQTVNTHSIQIGRNFRTMYIPTAATTGKSPIWEALQNLATPVALVTGTVGSADPAKAVPHEMWSEFQKEDFRGSIVINWFGLNIEVKKQNWMPAGYVILFSDMPSVLMWDRLTLESGQPADGVLETPVDGYYSYRSVSRNFAVARPDWALRNFLVLQVQS